MKVATCRNAECPRVDIDCNANSIPDEWEITCGTCGAVCERSVVEDPEP